MKKTKALSLISGGLDSILATWLILQQGVEVIGLTFSTPFFDIEKPKKVSELLNIPLYIIDITEEFLPILKNPKYGYGKNMNPCIDCHSFMLKKAKDLLKDLKADFIITGEVLGERPMSQNKQSLKIVEKVSGTEDILLRPLSAKLLPPTKPEREGLVDREKLLDIKGRSRKRQLELAKQIGLKEIPTPAGGCLLTEPNFSRRLRELFQNEKNISRRDLELLKLGRHFRINNDIKIIVGRNKEENEKIITLATEEDTIFKAEEPSPVVIVPNKTINDSELLEEIAKITAYYSDHKTKPLVRVKVKLKNKEKEVEVIPYTKEDFPYKPI